MLAAPLCAYAWGAVVLLDTQLDRQRPFFFHTAVVGKHMTGGRTRTPTLTIGPWGDVTEEDDIAVRRDLYEKAAKGQVLCVTLHRGALHAQWFAVDVCDRPWKLPECTIEQAVPAHPARTDASAEGEAESIRQLLASGNFADLDARMNGFQLAWERGEIDDVTLQRAFRAFYTDDPALEPAFAGWIAAFPGSYAAHLARAIGFREHGLASPKGEQREHWFELSRSELDRARAGKPILSEQLRMSIASYRRDDRELQRILERGNAMAPRNFILRRKYLYTLAAAWGSSHDRMVAFRKQLEAAGLTAAQLQALDAMVLADEGWVLSRRKGDLRSAADRYARAIELARPVRGLLENQGYTEMLGEGAWIASDLKNDRVALAYRDEILALDPDDANNVAQRAGSLLRMGRMREAVDGLQRAAAMGDAWAQNQLGTRYWWGDDVLAIDQRKALAFFACASRHGDPEAVRNLDWSLINFGK